MKHISTILALVIISVICFITVPMSAQQAIITLQTPDGTTSFFTNLTEAVAASTPSSNIYLSGGVYSANELVIDKRLNIYGAGHNPDSSHATGPTQVFGIVRLCTGSDSSFITGIYFHDPVYMGNSNLNQVVNGMILKRCRFASLNLGVDVTPPLGKGHIISECVIEDIYGYYSQNSIIEKNIFFTKIIGFGANNLFSNNIMIGNLDYLLYDINSCYFQNNIFSSNFYYGLFGNVNYCNFQNNLFLADPSFPNGTNTGINNIVNQPIESIYVNYSAWNGFLYTANYHLQPTCPGVGAGTDGTDIGIYGTAFPYKEGSIPINPHISISNIPMNTSNGKLPVHIEVKAQTR